MLVGCFSLLICGTCLLSVIYLLVANPPAVAKKPEPVPPWMLHNPAPVPQPVAPPFAQQPNNVGVARAPQFPWEGDQFEISNPRWDGRPGDFSIDFVSLNDRMFLGNYNVHCKHDDGSVSKADIRLFNSQRGTITIRTFAMEFGRPKKQKQAMEIWIESGFGGQKVSNILYLD